jgi:hypothetical protein
MARRQYWSIGLSLALTMALACGAGVSLAQDHLSLVSPSAAGERGQDAQVVRGDTQAKAERRSFVVSGAVQDLWPNVAKPLALTVTNVNQEPIHLLALSAAADNPHGCMASKNLRITDYDATRPGATQYNVPANRSIVVPLQITLLDIPGNQKLCSGVTFRLTYSGEANGAGGGR